MVQSSSATPRGLPDPPAELMARCDSKSATQADMAELYDHCEGMLRELRRQHRTEFRTLRQEPSALGFAASLPWRIIEALEERVPSPLQPGDGYTWDTPEEQRRVAWDFWLERFDQFSGELARLRSENGCVSAPLTLPRR